MSKEDERIGERSEEELALIRKRLQQAARWSEGGPVPAEPSAPPPESTDGAAAKPKKRRSRKKKAVAAAADTAVQAVERTESALMSDAEPEKKASADTVPKADAEPDTKTSAEPVPKADAEPETKASAEPERKAKPVKRRRTAKGEKAMEEKPVKTETVPAKQAEKAKEPAAVTAKSAEPENAVKVSETAEPSKPVELEKAPKAEKTAEKPSGAAEPSEAVKPSDTAEPSEAAKPADTAEPSETAKPAETAKPSETAKPAETAKPSETPETPQEAVPAFAPASEEAFQEILEEERKETERQEEEERETPRKAYGFLAKLADKKLPPWLARIVDRLQKMELPEKVNLPKWFGPINNLNLPNQLTLLRILLIPVMMGILYWGFPGSRYVALLVFIAASVTDLLDGRIARKYNLVTDFGKFADPLADKMLVTAAMLWFVSTGQMGAWALLIVVCREFAVSGLRMLASGKGRVIAAGWSGKVKTAATMVCLVLMFFPIPALLNTVCVWIITLTTLYSGVEYFLLNKDVIVSI